ncbi:MAG: flagellar protein FliT [Halospina sp.]
MAALDDMVSRVESLVAAKDWASLAALDQEVRQCVDEAVDDAERLGQERVRAGVERLQALYDQARAGSEEERDEAAEALRSNNRTQKAAQAYLDNQ